MNAYSNVAPKKGPSDDDLVIRHVTLVKRIASHLAARLPSTVDIDDLLQAGMVGLLEAAGNFDASKGASFETYAGIRIRGAMLDDIRKNDWTPRSVHQKYRQLSESMAAIEAETGRPAEAAEVAARLGVSMDEYHKILADSAGSRLFSLEESSGDSTYQRPLPASNTPTPEQEISESQFRDGLADAIDRLPERERLVLSLYYEQELNLKEIGEVFEVSESRVCQIHSQAVARLRTIVSPK